MLVKATLCSTKTLLLITVFWLLGLTTPQFATAQTSTTEPPDQKSKPVEEQRHTYLEQMPQLPGGGGKQAITKAIYSRLHYPTRAEQLGIEGVVMVYFIVTKTGEIRDEKIVRRIGGGCEEAVLLAVRDLPRFTPGTQQGKPVDVGMTLPVTFRMQNSKADLLDTLNRVYPLVNQMPHLPGSQNNSIIAQTIQRALVMPAEVANDTLVRKVFVGFIVGPSGVIRDVKIIRGLNASCNAAALTAVRQLPRFVGGKLNGLPASVSMTVPVLFGRLPQKP